MSSGKIFEIKRFAVHDGPGIRTTVFFKGCPLSCRWCHNPEGISYDLEIALLERLCAGCGECFAACPQGLHTMDESGAHTFEREGCKLCMTCADACMPQAIKLFGTDYTPEALYKIAAEDIDFYKQSGGGVTCSGGEPLMQPGFAADFLRLCKINGIHTSVDTSGCAPWAAFETILPFTDLFLYDIKHMDPLEHKKLTGVDNRLILENLAKLSGQGVPVEIRMPVIPGLNDDEENILRSAGFFKNLKQVTLIRPLPYHALSGSKYASMGKKHAMPAATGNENAAVRRVSEILKAEGLSTIMDF